MRHRLVSDEKKRKCSFLPFRELAIKLNGDAGNVLKVFKHRMEI